VEVVPGTDDTAMIATSTLRGYPLKPVMPRLLITVAIDPYSYHYKQGTQVAFCFKESSDIL